MPNSDMETWELWYPDAAATGLLFARARIDATGVVWVHAAPSALAVTVRNSAGERVARANRLARRGERLPMTRLVRTGSDISREDRWPTESDLGAVVILAGGEAGILMSWRNAEDQSEWRWQLEFYNQQ